MNENPRVLVAFCLEKYCIAYRAHMLSNMLVSPNVDQHVGTVCGRLYLLILKQNLASVFREDIHPE